MRLLEDFTVQLKVAFEEDSTESIRKSVTRAGT